MKRRSPDAWRIFATFFFIPRSGIMRPPRISDAHSRNRLATEMCLDEVYRSTRLTEC